ncbi:Linoleate 9S-lipoxygenase 2 [Platanthera guangdongensis]|uniref:Linoleate 9S-lipoxygenase 2 n=1 Tax=Platanthera guangdongensis TaxID=2320717 RepID=A0ABR2LF45_9ASPA
MELEDNGNRGVVGEKAYLEPPLFSILPNIVSGEMQFGVTFHVQESEGIPGAVIVKNLHPAEYTFDHVFFSNDNYLSKDTPSPLRWYTEELRHLRGDDMNMKLEEWDQVYNYVYYNNLDNMDGVRISPGRFSAALPRTLIPATGCG